MDLRPHPRLHRHQCLLPVLSPAGLIRAASTPARPRPLPPLPLLLVAAVAMVDVDGRVLLAQRPAGQGHGRAVGVPGRQGPRTARRRRRRWCASSREELGIDITESCLAPFTFASHRYAESHLLMPLYLCRVWKGTPTPLEGQALRWLRPLAMPALPMPPADAPLVAMLRDFL